MPTYVYQCPVDGYVEEEWRSAYEPYPTPHCPKYWDHESGVEMKLVIQPSMLIFGDFEMGDDDFSRRYWLNGADEISKPNRTQGATNVNAVMRKWGRKGMPLEARTDIDSSVMTDRPLPSYENSDLPAGHMPAPAALTPAVELPSTSDYT